MINNHKQSYIMFLYLLTVVPSLVSIIILVLVRTDPLSRSVLNTGLVITLRHSDNIIKYIDNIVSILVKHEDTKTSQSNQ